MNELIFADYSSIDINLVSAWRVHNRIQNIDWTEFVESQCGGINECIRMSGRRTKVIFKSEAHKTWFVLRWT